MVKFIGSPLTHGFYLVYSDGTIVEYQLTQILKLKKVYQTKVAYDKCGYVAFVDQIGNLQIGGGSGSFMLRINSYTKRKTYLDSEVVPNKLVHETFDPKTIKVAVGTYIWILGGGHGECPKGKQYSNFITCRTFY